MTATSPYLNRTLRTLEQAQRDDPLVLAKARIRDARMVSAARLFNALAEPAGHALFTSTLVFPMGHTNGH